jgi:hypothetical protein
LLLQDLTPWLKAKVYSNFQVELLGDLLVRSKNQELQRIQESDPEVLFLGGTASMSAAVVAAWRKAPLIVVIVLGAAVTALVRQL